MRRKSFQTNILRMTSPHGPRRAGVHERVIPTRTEGNDSEPGDEKSSRVGV